MKKLDNPCGTTTGYKRHRKDFTIPCQECLNAVVEYKKSWKLANPEKAKQRNKDYYEKNSHKVNKKNRKFRIDNPDKVKSYQDAYRKEHKKDRNVYRLNNLEKFRSYARKRKSLKLKNGHEPYTEEQVLAYWGNECHICLQPIDFKASRKVGVKDWEKGFHVDHLVSLAKGGGDTIDNVRPAHAICNLRKNAKDYQEATNV